MFVFKLGTGTIVFYNQIVPWPDGRESRKAKSWLTGIWRLQLLTRQRRLHYAERICLDVAERVDDGGLRRRSTISLKTMTYARS